jgi:hypothetical protein
MLQRSILNRAQNVLDVQALCYGDDVVTQLDIGSGQGKSLRGLTTELTCIEVYAPFIPPVCTRWTSSLLSNS